MRTGKPTVFILRDSFCAQEANDTSDIFNLKVLEGSIKLRAPSAANRATWEEHLVRAQRLPSIRVDDVARPPARVDDDGATARPDSSMDDSPPPTLEEEAPPPPPPNLSPAPPSETSTTSSSVTRKYRPKAAPPEETPKKYRVNTSGNDMLNMLKSAGYVASVKHTVTAQQTREGVSRQPSLNGKSSFGDSALSKGDDNKVAARVPAPPPVAPPPPATPPAAPVLSPRTGTVARTMAAQPAPNRRSAESGAHAASSNTSVSAAATRSQDTSGPADRSMSTRPRRHTDASVTTPQPSAPYQATPSPTASSPRPGNVSRTNSARPRRNTHSGGLFAPPSEAQQVWGEREAESWILQVVGLDSIPDDKVDLWRWLRDGTVLCELVEALRPGVLTGKKVHKNSKLPFMMRENISTFLAVCRDDFGVESSNLFDAPDLYEGKGPQQVLYCLGALKRQIDASSPAMTTPAPSARRASVGSTARGDNRMPPRSPSSASQPSRLAQTRVGGAPVATSPIVTRSGATENRMRSGSPPRAASASPRVPPASAGSSPYRSSGIRPSAASPRADPSTPPPPPPPGEPVATNSSSTSRGKPNEELSSLTPKSSSSSGDKNLPSMFTRQPSRVDVDPTYVPTHQTAASKQNQSGDDSIISDGFATVVAEHDANDGDELTVFIGDVVNVKLARGGWCFAEENEGWVLVQKGGEQGLVPASCLKAGISDDSYFKAGGGRGSSALDKELKAKAAAKYDPIAEALAQHWIEQVTGHVFRKPFAEELKDGVVLCRLVNKIKEGSVSKIYEGSKAFGQMDNISNFLKAIKKFGVLPSDTFETLDLFEMKDLNIVVQCLFALSKVIVKAVPEWEGPNLTGQEAGLNEAVMSNLKVIIAVSEHRDRHRHYQKENSEEGENGAVQEDVVSEAVEYRLAMLGLRDTQGKGANVKGVDRATLEPSYLVVWSSSTKSTLAMEKNERRLVQLLAAKKKRYEMVYLDVSPERKIELATICKQEDVELPALTFGADYVGTFEELQELEDNGDFDELVAPAPEGEGFWALPEAWGVQSSMLDGGGMQIINEVPPM